MSDECVPREPVVERIEALADNPDLAEHHEPGSEAESAYVKGVGEAAEVVKKWPQDERP